MEYVLGVDIGTSAAKAILVDSGGAIVASGVADYPLIVPQPNWAEQNPEDWWNGCVRAIKSAIETSGVTGQDIAAVGLSGQMHGSVFLDSHNEVIRPALLWCDQRTEAECREIVDRVGFEQLIRLTANRALTGFTAPKILWLRNHEADAYRKVTRVLLPKDYIRLRLTGSLATDVSDASGTLLFDVRGRRWSGEMLELLGIPPEWLPPCSESIEVSGHVDVGAAAMTGLAAGIPVIAGGGDQACGGVGNGIISPGLASCVIGTSGVVFAHTETPVFDPEGRSHTFCHAVPGKWHVMGVTLAAGGSLRWFRDALCREEIREARARSIDPYELITKEAEAIAPGSEGLYFLPYLSGERTPYADPNARGVFAGLSLRHTKAHMVRAVMEGVCYSLRDCMELIKRLGVPVTEIRASGGGARSGLWREMLANILGVPVYLTNSYEGPAFGAALLAAVAAGMFADVAGACNTAIRVVEETVPDPDLAERYARLYEGYRRLYPSLSGWFASST